MSDDPDTVQQPRYSESSLRIWRDAEAMSGVIDWRLRPGEGDSLRRYVRCNLDVVLGSIGAKLTPEVECGLMRLVALIQSATK